MSASPGPWDTEAFNTTLSHSTYDQFLSLKLATNVTSGMSLAACIMIFIVYIYMLLYHRNEANRVSLRCVFVCSFFEILIAVMNILMSNERASTNFCSGADLVVEFSNVATASLLTMVGLNLVLIFVINVSRRDLLERIYYPAVLLYVLAGISMSIRDQVIQDSDAEYLLLSCWYVVYIEDRNYNGITWMWFYAFIFFVNLLAIICSVLALVKLIKQLRMFAAQLQNDNDNSSVANRRNEDQMQKSIKKRQSSVFTKVVLRCIIYPLVPFLVNIFGLINQLNMVVNNTPPTFAMTMLDIIFASLEGFFVAIVFFTDPAITSLTKKSYRASVQKYVQEYTKVTQEEADKNNDMITAPTNGSTLNTNKSSTGYAANPNTTSTLPNTAGLAPHDDHIYDTSRPSDDDRSIRQLQQKRGNYSTKSIAMRKVQVEVTRQITYSRKNSGGSARHQKHGSPANSTFSSAPAISSESTVVKSYNAPTPTGSQSHSQTSISTTLKDMYLPYSSPFMATIYHFILTVICRVKKKPDNYLPPNTERDTFCVQEEEEYTDDEDYYEQNNDIPGSSSPGFNRTNDDDSEKINIYTRAAQKRRKTIASTQHF